MKKSLLGAASAVGAATVLSTVGFAGPAQAVSACWDTSNGRDCRDYGSGGTGLAKVQSVQHPTFAGVLAAGQTLTSSPGLWESNLHGPITLTYQWLRDGLVIPGAVGETYKITEPDTGRSLALRVTASEEGLKDGVATTLPSPKVSATNTVEYTARPGVTGEAPKVWGWSRVGFELDADYGLGTWSPRDIVVTLQWQADGVDIPGATSPTYTPKSADLGKKVTLKVTGEGVSMSNTAGVVTGGYIESPDEMAVTGGSKVGDTLRVESLGGWYAGGEPVSLHYQWERDYQPITGATASTYNISAADQGHQIHVEVTATAPGYAPHTQAALYVVVGSETGGDGVTDPGGGPDAPAQVPDPAPVQAPVQVPAQVPAPVQVPVQVPAPVQVPEYQAPVGQPPAGKIPALHFVQARTGGGYVQAQASGQAQAPVADAGVAAGLAVAPAEAAPAADPTPSLAESAVAAAPDATATPAPSATSSPEPAALATEQSSGTGDFHPLRLVLTLGGLLIAAGLVWFVRPVRAAVTRILARKAN